MDGLAHGGVARKMRHNTSFVGLGQQNGLASQEALAHAIPWAFQGPGERLAAGVIHRYEKTDRLTDAQETSGRAERRPDARDVRRPRLVRRPRDDVLDLDVCWARRRIDNLIGDVVRDHRYQIVVD